MGVEVGSGGLERVFGRPMLALASLLVRCTSTRVGHIVLAEKHRLVDGLGAVVDHYDAVLLDQFGVLHDGEKAIPGAIDCYEKLHAAGKKLVVLSNTSRRRAFALKKLPKLGFGAEKLSGFVTSGEATWEYLLERCGGQRVLWLSWDSEFAAWDPTYLDGLDLSLAPAHECDLLLCQGVGRIRDGSESPAATDLLHSGELGEAAEQALAVCASRGVPMVCANPDLHVVLPDGAQGHMPGQLAAAYEALGGLVTYFGKPHRAGFEACLACLPSGIERSRVLHVGDSLTHDVAGAADAGIHSLFVAGGIHADELAAAEAAVIRGEGTAASRLEALDQLFAANAGAEPTYTAQRFVW